MDDFGSYACRLPQPLPANTFALLEAGSWIRERTGVSNKGRIKLFIRETSRYHGAISRGLS